MSRTADTKLRVWIPGSRRSAWRRRLASSLTAPRPKCGSFLSIASREWKLLIHAVMTLELMSEVSGWSYDMTPKALGKLLHMAKLEGWQPERVSHQWPSDSWETQIILPHFELYMSGRVSRADA